MCERESVCVRVCVCERERERVCVRERERECVCVSDGGVLDWIPVILVAEFIYHKCLCRF